MDGWWTGVNSKPDSPGPQSLQRGPLNEGAEKLPDIRPTSLTFRLSAVPFALR